MSELKKSALQGVRWTTISAGTVAVGGLAQTFILTRLLAPGDFGAMAIVNVALGLTVQLVDMGFSNAIIRDQGTTKNQLSSLYWLNVGMGMFFAVLVFLIAGPVGAFYQMEALPGMLRWLSPAFVLSGLSMQFQALLQKNLRFNTIALVEVVSFIVGFVIAIGLAYWGWGPMALVSGALGKSITASVAYFALGSKEYRPGFHFEKADIAPFWRFGLFQSFEKLIGYFAINLDTLLIGKLLGKEILGIYEVMKRILIQPWYVINPIITKVVYPVMSQVQNDQPRLRNIALRAVNMVGIINIPIYVGCAVGAALFFPVLFDERWHTGIEPFRWLAIYFMVRAVINPLGSVILAKGKAHISFLLQVIALFGLIGGISIGSFYGLRGVLMGLLIFNIVLLIPVFYMIVKPLLNGTWQELGKQVQIELAGALLSFGSVFYLLDQFDFQHWVALLLYLSGGGLLYLAIVFLFRPHLVTEVKQMLGK